MCKLSLAIGIVICLASSVPTQATIVRFETVMGDFDVQLLDDDTPGTVENFLNYVNSGKYIDSFIHRSALLQNGDKFVIQGGGFTLGGEGAFPGVVPVDRQIQNEPGFSNIRGSIAMAKLGGQPHSATSQWFINLNDDNTFLDTNNDGFTVFGGVIGQGMDVVDAISFLDRDNLNTQLVSALTEVPVRGDDSLPLDARLVIINDVYVLPVSGAFHKLFGEFDIDSSGNVDTADVAAMIDDLQTFGNRQLPSEAATESPLFVDINYDDISNPVDLISLIREVNRLDAAEGEMSFASAAVTAVPEPSTLGMLAFAVVLVMLANCLRPLRRSKDAS